MPTLYFHFYINNDGDLVRILSYSRPGPNTKPPSGIFWVCFEFDSIEKRFVLARAPELSWPKIRTFKWIGKLKA